MLRSQLHPGGRQHRKKTDTADFPRPRAKTRPHKPPPAPPGALLWTTNRPCLGSEVGFAAERSASAAPTQPQWGLAECYDRSQNAVRWRCWQRPAGWVPLPMMPHASKARTGCAWGVGGGSSGAASPLAVHREAPRSTCRLPWPRQHGDQAPPNGLSVVDITNPIAIGPCPIATNPQGTSAVAWWLP